ncbi:hypothetical protein [Janthinobacterium sp. LB2P10]|uniref:hypothetical protein n=1 Tax=Janthinobacterium sp. LB2P10 TaxID=3424194 RepID=UPI003F1F5D73
MGFEFRITAGLTQEQRQHIAQLLATRSQAPDAPDAALPETDIRLTDAGLYICQHLRADPWHALASLRAYLDASGMSYTVEEIDD